MKIYIRFLLLVTISLFISCKDSKDQRLRQVYLQEHAENCRFLTRYTLFYLDWNKYKYNDTGYFNRYKTALEACTAFYDFLIKDLYPPEKPYRGTSYRQWKKAERLQQNAYREVQTLLPSLFRNKVSVPVLETMEALDSPELKIAKYHSNCLRISHILLRLLQWAEEPLVSPESSYNFITLQVAPDTVHANQPVHTLATSARLNDYRNYTYIRNINDLQLIRTDCSKEHFVFRVTGPEPRCLFTYFDTHYLKEVTHEICF